VAAGDVSRPVDGEGGEVGGAADEFFGDEVVVEGLRAFLVEFLPVGLPIILIGALYSAIYELRRAQSFHFAMGDGQPDSDGFGKVFHFFVPDLTDFVCTEGLRRASHFDLNHPTKEFKLIIVLRVIHIVHCFFAGHGAIHNSD